MSWAMPNRSCSICSRAIQRCGRFASECCRPARKPETETERARRIGNFIAGMTDRFALTEHQRLFDSTPDLR